MLGPRRRPRSPRPRSRPRAGAGASAAGRSWVPGRTVQQPPPSLCTWAGPSRSRRRRSRTTRDLSEFMHVGCGKRRDGPRAGPGSPRGVSGPCRDRGAAGRGGRTRGLHGPNPSPGPAIRPGPTLPPHVRLASAARRSGPSRLDCRRGKKDPEATGAEGRLFKFPVVLPQKPTITVDLPLLTLGLSVLGSVKVSTALESGWGLCVGTHRVGGKPVLRREPPRSLSATPNTATLDLPVGRTAGRHT